MKNPPVYNNGCDYAQWCNDYEQYIAEKKAEAIEAIEVQARIAFWGGNEALSDHLLMIHGYEENGIWYKANCASLADYIKWAQELSDGIYKRLTVI